MTKKTRKNKAKAPKIPPKPRPMPEPDPVEPYVIPEELGKTIAACLTPYALYETIDPAFASTLGDVESLRERPKLRELLELLAEDSAKSSRRERKRGWALPGAVLHEALDEATAEGLPEPIGILIQCLFDLGSTSCPADFLSADIEKFPTQGDVTDSPTLNACIERLTHILRFDAVEGPLELFDDEHYNSVWDYLTWDFEDYDVTEDIPFDVPDGLARLMWMTTVELFCDRVDTLKEWDSELERGKNGDFFNPNYSRMFSWHDPFYGSARNYRFMMRTLRCVLPRLSTRKAYDSLESTTVDFIARLLEVCAAAQFDCASQAVALAYLTDPMTGDDALPDETLRDAMECVLAAALIETQPPDDDAEPVEELPPNLRTPAFERFHEVLLTFSEHRQAALEELAATEPVEALRPTYARLAKLQGVLRSTVGRSVPELARQAVLLADDMPAAIQAGTPLFERILVLAEGASIVAELDWYCVKEACDLLILLEALADSIEDQLEDEHLLKHIVFRHLRIALDRAFDLDAVLPDEDDEDGYYYWYGDADEDEEEKEDDESEDFGEDDDAGSRLRAANLSSPS